MKTQPPWPLDIAPDFVLPRTLDDRAANRSREPSPDECVDHEAAIDPVLLWRELVECYGALNAAVLLLRRYDHSNLELNRCLLRASEAVRAANRAMGRQS